MTEEELKEALLHIIEINVALFTASKENKRKSGSCGLSIDKAMAHLNELQAQLIDTLVNRYALQHTEPKESKVTSLKCKVELLHAERDEVVIHIPAMVYGFRSTPSVIPWLARCRLKASGSIKGKLKVVHGSSVYLDVGDERALPIIVLSKETNPEAMQELEDAIADLED